MSAIAGVLLRPLPNLTLFASSLLTLTVESSAAGGLRRRLSVLLTDECSSLDKIALDPAHSKVFAAGGRRVHCVCECMTGWSLLRFLLN